jgi:hypothetical protein
MEREQTAVLRAPRDLLAGQPAGPEIGGVEDRPLPRGELRAASVDFVVAYLTNSTLERHTRTIAPLPAAKQDVFVTTLRQGCA